MSLILCIDTALQIGAVALCENGKCIAVQYSHQQQEHASFLQPAILQLMQEAGRPLSDVEAVAVSNGPGSYTGLRVGLASAKGLCFALQIPLITLSTLQIMAHAMQQQVAATEKPYLLCPMIDARRMEVFTTLYNDEMGEILPASAVVLDPGFLENYLANQIVFFGGNGSEKWKSIVRMTNAKYIDDLKIVESFCVLAQENFEQKNWANLTYAVPFYCKAFYQPMPVNKGV
jgi:tRNA threonylcarbamoyladenosine biosynthesis protein TsaB